MKKLTALMRKLALIMATISIVAIATFAYGEPGGHGIGPGMMCGCDMEMKMMDGERHMQRYIAGLNLDEQQKAFMNEIKSRMKKETIRRTADISIARIELKELLSRDTADMKAIEAKLRQLEMMKTEMHLSHIRAMEECKTRLSPEQRKKFRELITEEPVMGKMEMKHDHECGMKKK